MPAPNVPPMVARPASPDAERRRARLVILLATIGIAAALIAYAISPGVRHAVSHAAHSVGNVLDRDKKKATHHGARSTPSQPPARPGATTSTPTTGGGGSGGSGYRTPTGTTTTGGAPPGI
jgi:hypothetical protein